MSKPSSKVWEFYAVNAVSNKLANCLICSDKISRGGNDARSFGTSALINHLKAKHPTHYTLYKEDKSKKINDSVESQPTLDKFLTKNKSFCQTDKRHIQITKKLGEMIAVDMNPFSIVEDIGFRRLNKKIN